MNSLTNPTDFPEPTLIAVNGVELEVFEAGRQNAGKPVVLCHGWPDLAFTWRHQVPALVAAGYHVIAPNQRGYGNSSRPAEVTAYDVAHLADDLVALLDHYDYEDATFIGHDWGAMVVWSLTLLHPTRVNKVICLSLPYPVRGATPWLEFMEAVLGSDYYFVHFNRQPGVADAVFDENPAQFLRNLYRKKEPRKEPQPGMVMIDLARAETPFGEPLMSDSDLAVYVSAFEKSGFTGGINWYRNFDRNWELTEHLAGAKQNKPAFFVAGAADPVILMTPPSIMDGFVTDLRGSVIIEGAGHWVQQEKPGEVNAALLGFLADVWPA
jgi:pimeloyl-ACP methyl ester carboxylesterase